SPSTSTGPPAFGTTTTITTTPAAPHFTLFPRKKSMSSQASWTGSDAGGGVSLEDLPPLLSSPPRGKLPALPVRSGRRERVNGSAGGSVGAGGSGAGGS